MSAATASAGRRRRAAQPSAGTRELAAIGYLLIGAGLATVAAWPVYQTWRLVVVSAVAVAIGLTVASLTRRRAWWVAALAAAGAYLLVAVPVAVPYRTTSVPDLLAGIAEAVGAIVVGWQHLLTLRLPVQEYRASLALWLAVLTAAMLIAARCATAPGRRAVIAVPALTLAVAVGPLLGPAQAGQPWRVGPVELPDPWVTVPVLGFTAVSLVWLTLRPRIARRQAVAAAREAGTGIPLARRLGSGLIRCVVGGTLAALALATGLIVADQTDPAARRSLRADTEPVIAVQAEPSPLDAYRTAFTGDAADQVWLHVQSQTAEGADPVDRLRLAVLDDYDGQHFSTSADTADHRFARVPRSRSAATTATVEIEIDTGYRGLWLPLSAGVLAAPEFQGPRADALAAGYYHSAWADAALITTTDPEGLTGLRATDRYRVTASPVAGGPLGAPTSTSTLDADAHPQLIAWVQSQQLGADEPGLRELVGRLRDRGYLSHWLTEQDARSAATDQSPPTVVPSRSGHSAARIEDLFADLNEQQDKLGADAPTGDLVAAAGDDEQFATAAALIARHLGYESRVVLGWRLTTDDPTLTSCTETCTGGMLAAWVEVRSAAGHWVTLDATPSTPTHPARSPRARCCPNTPPGSNPPTRGGPAASSADDTGDTPPADTDTDEAGTQGWRSILRITGLTLSAIALLAAPVAAIPVAKALRRRSRRTAAVPEVAVVGAWAELSDLCLDLGRPLTGATRISAATATERPAAVALAELTDRAVFGPIPVDRDTSAAAWELVAADRTALAATHSPWARLVAALRPRSLVAAAHPALTRRNRPLAEEEPR
ncbi:transglutaminase domain-containing protein [Cellulomonas denverensis]|uniref:transglutaminase domain-containing protein n=1 Tax=Cellulomonas denverensis TaxID=264297 RepID=UPI0035E6F775